MERTVLVKRAIGVGVVIAALSAPVAWSALKGDAPLDVAPAAAPALRDTTYADSVSSMAAAAELAERWENLAAIQFRNVALVVHEAERQAAARAVQPRSSGGGSSYAFVGEGDCYGSELPDYIVSAESGGNPNARNASGAWGCAQFMPGTWNGSCSDLGAHGSASVEAQNECANRLWAGGSGSSHWAATR